MPDAMEQWLSKQVADYSEAKPKYDRLGEVLPPILKRIADEVLSKAIVSVRVKGISSFAGKCVKYHRNRTRDGRVFEPFNAMEAFNDLCGARIIVHERRQISAIRSRIEAVFDVLEDWSAESQLPPTQFGYRSHHMILRMSAAGEKRSALEALLTDGDKAALDGLEGLRAELQLRTIAAHAWADFEHDMSYNLGFDLPREAMRDSAQLSALLESVDDAMSEHAERIRALITNNGPYRNREDMEHEVNRLKLILKHGVCDGSSPDGSVVARTARLLVNLGRCDEVIKLLDPMRDELTAQELVDLGYALCQVNRSDRSGADPAKWNDGVSLLKAAGDVESLTRLAELSSPKAVGGYWRQAYAADPTNPRALAGFLRHEITELKHREFVALLRPNIESAVRICEQQVELGINLPFAMFHMAQFHLMMERVNDSLCWLCRAVALTTDDGILEQTLHEARHFHLHHPNYPGLDWWMQILELSKATRRSGIEGSLNNALPAEIQAMAGEPIASPVLILAGGCNRSVEDEVRGYTELLRFALADFHGTIICGGTRHGISDVVGELLAESNGRLRGMSWLPERIANDVQVDERYHDRRTIPGANGFSPAEPLRAWMAILASGVHPSQVKVIGVNGGPIASFEYRLAAALGGVVGLIRGSGRAANELARQDRAYGHDRIHVLPADREALRAFVNHPPRPDLSAHDLGAIAEKIEEAYQQAFAHTTLTRELEQRKQYPELHQAFENSNLQQAAHIDEKLRRIGLHAVPARGAEARVYQFNDEQIEQLAEMEHGRWVVERTLAGWRLGPRDDARRQRPQLVSWDELNLQIEEKSKDISAVKNIPRFLCAIGYEIVPIEDVE